ncbi:hypothetical protein [Massilia sp. LC238]|uniref:hypothetical protein n=1 Tax=Massilia sp. LC238 TaxID=1502852 RepID=UPI0004E29379|nr:hypothetical protein [Massilia sp. LC238]KFC62322.1 hypothetical protein FG94_04848 [Massilia sp. LC238]
MPFIALNSDNEEVTASHCRDEFLRTRVIRSDFKCAFCFCPYFARYIYVDGKIGRAPHFVIKGEGHRGNCDGTPLDVAPEVLSKLQGKRIRENEFRFPEKLVARQRPRVTAIPPTESMDTPSNEDIAKRRRRAGKEYGASTFTSSLLQVIVESKTKINRWCYSEIAKKKLGAKEGAELFRETAGSYPLQLFEQKDLNYDNAFWSGNFERLGPGERIFHAKHGVAIVSQSGFIVRSEPLPASPSLPKKDKQPLPVEVRYDGESYDDGQAPRSHIQLMQELGGLTPSQAIQWFAYGQMTREKDLLVVHLKTLDHFHYKEE